jgi:hypothetical protein
LTALVCAVLPAAVAEGPEVPFTMLQRWQKALASMVKKAFERHAHRAVNPPREGANMRKPHAP